MFATLQTAITRNSFLENTFSLSELIGYVEFGSSFQEFLPEPSVGIEEEQQGVGYFLHHGYFSCDRRERNKVGKLFDTITLWVNEKVTNKNTGKPDTIWEVEACCAVLKHQCPRLVPD